nr:DUF2953 domain-containing protein [Bacillus sp. B15-48]
MVKLNKENQSLTIKEKVEVGPDDKTVDQQEKQFDKQDLLNSLDDTKALLEHVVGLHTHIRKLFNKVSVKKLEWHTAVGIGEAASTAVLCGAIWSVKGSIIGLISNYMRMKEMPVVTVTPIFQQTLSQIQLKCIFQIRIGHAILAGLKLVRYWKGGMPNFKTRPLSALSGDKTNSV